MPFVVNLYLFVGMVIGTVSLFFAIQRIDLKIHFHTVIAIIAVFIFVVATWPAWCVVAAFDIHNKR